MGFIISAPSAQAQIPGIVGNWLSLFKDTSLVAIVGIKDLLNQDQKHDQWIEWSSPTPAHTGYIFAAALFRFLCSQQVAAMPCYWERRLDRRGRRPTPIR